MATIPLDQQSLAGSSNQPALGSDQTIESLFDLAPGGVYHAFPIARKAVSSYLAISPLPLKRTSKRRFVFCCAFRRISAPGRYPASCLAVPGLSSLAFARAAIRCPAINLEKF